MANCNGCTRDYLVVLQRAKAVTSEAMRDRPNMGRLLAGYSAGVKCTQCALDADKEKRGTA